MKRIWLTILIIVPAIELGLLILLGKSIGIIPTILMIILTGVIGLLLAKKEGMNTIRLTQMQLARGEIPSDVLLDGICILMGGLLLLAPGFLTDFVGLYLIIPFTRGSVKVLLIKLFQRLISRRNMIFFTRR